MGSHVRRVILAAVVVLLLVEAAVTVAGPRLGDPLPYGLEPPLEWLHADYQRLIGEMDEMQSRGERLDLVLVGTSMVMFDLRVDILEDGLSSIRRAGNAAAPDATAAIAHRWLIEEVIPRTNPRRVIWGVSTLDFNSQRNRLEAYERTRPGTPGVFGELDRLLSSVSSLSRYRELLRRPGPVLDVLRDRPPAINEVRDGPLDSAPFTPTSKSPEVLQQTIDFLDGFRIDGVELAALNDTATVLGELGVELVVVLMPVPSEYVAAHPGGREQFEAWIRWIEGEAERLGIVLLDHSDSMVDSAFPDYTHLGPAGATDFSRAVVDDLLLLGW